MRELAYSLAGTLGVCRLLRMRRRVPIFCFHNVTGGAPEAGDRSLHIPSSAFARYAAWIAHTYTVIPLRELAERLARGRPEAGLAAITFDDAYAGVVDHALPVLGGLGLPCTVFVVSGASDAPTHFWWDVLSSGTPLDGAGRERCLEELAGDREACLAGRGPMGAALGPEFLPAAWDRLASASEDVEFGVHTVTHRNLARLDPSDVEEELAGCRSAIEGRLGRRADLVAYPYGRYTPGVAATARALGFTAGVVLEGRLAGPGDDRLMLPRITVPAGITLPALECRAVDLQRLALRRD